MSIDLASFYDSFFDEAEELLQGMEQTLLCLDVQQPDKEDLNAIFRAAHSIKGGAATFGSFETLVQTTHKVENVLDAIRHGQCPMTELALNLFLRAKDVLADQIVAYRQQMQPSQAEAQALIEALEAIDQPAAEAVDSPVELPALPAEPAPETAAAGTGAALTLFQIRFTDVKSADLETLKNELSLMGELREMEISAQHAVMQLRCDLEESVVRAICGFVIHDDQMVIEIVQNPVPKAVESVVQKEEAQTARTTESQRSTQPVMASPKAVAKDGGTIRVPTVRVDILVNQVGEVVINQSILSQAVNRLDPIEHAALLQGFEQMAGALRSLQESIMSLRMVPMDYAFGRYPRVVRETAAKLNKSIELKTLGGGTELDKGLIEKMIDPLTHLIRNSMDHGIETPEVRRANGKAETGTITISAYQEGGRIVIAVADDGAGINREKVIAKAMERGLPASPNMSDNDAFQLLFLPSFSTAEKVTDVSGRGVGMDVVRRNIQEVGGQIKIESVLGAGTTIYISLPLTLAIMDGMSLQVGEECFVMPIAQIAECLQPQSQQIHKLSNGTQVLSLRGAHLPILHLAKFFDIQGSIEDMSQAILVVAQVGADRYALAVDRLLGQHQVVIKNLETHYKKVPGTSGATILGDGSVALILDAAQLNEFY